MELGELFDVDMAFIFGAIAWLVIGIIVIKMGSFKNVHAIFKGIFVILLFPMSIALAKRQANKGN